MISTLDDLPQETREILIRLPFRVGMWISQVDRTGGSEAVAREREALDTIVTAYAEDYLKSEFVQRLMEATLAQRAEWDGWTVAMEQVPNECDRVVKILSDHLPVREVSTFKNNLMEIAVAVAMAYRESQPAATAMGGFTRLMGHLLGGFRTATADENISALEHQALKELARTLGVRSAFIASAT